MLMTISEFLKLEREKRCLTQAQMAEKLGVNRATYNSYEKGWVDKKKNNYLRVPGLKVRTKIAKLTGCSKEYVNELIENERKEKR